MPEKEKYEVVLEAIEAGNQTDDTLMELLGTKSVRGVKNQFKFINVLKKYPWFDPESGMYIILNAEQWDAVCKTDSASKEAAKRWTDKPQAKRETMESRFGSKISKMNASKAKLGQDPGNTLLKLRHKIAECEFHIANILLNEFKSGMCAELGIDPDVYQESENLDALQETAKAAEATTTPVDETVET